MAKAGAMCRHCWHKQLYDEKGNWIWCPKCGACPEQFKDLKKSKTFKSLRIEK